MSDGVGFTLLSISATIVRVSEAESPRFTLPCASNPPAISTLPLASIAPVNVDTPTANISPSGLSVIPLPTLIPFLAVIRPTASTFVTSS